MIQCVFIFACNLFISSRNGVNLRGGGGGGEGKKEKPNKKVNKWKLRKRQEKGGEVKRVAADGFDPSTSGLWAQHASTAPRCFHSVFRAYNYSPVKPLVKLKSDNSYGFCIYETDVWLSGLNTLMHDFSVALPLTGKSSVVRQSKNINLLDNTPC